MLNSLYAKQHYRESKDPHPWIVSVEIVISTVSILACKTSWFIIIPKTHEDILKTDRDHIVQCSSNGGEMGGKTIIL